MTLMLVYQLQALSSLPSIKRWIQNSLDHPGLEIVPLMFELQSNVVCWESSAWCTVSYASSTLCQFIALSNELHAIAELYQVRLITQKDFLNSKQQLSPKHARVVC